MLSWLKYINKLHNISISNNNVCKYYYYTTRRVNILTYLIGNDICWIWCTPQ